MPRTVRQRQEGIRVKRTTKQRSNLVKVAALQLKKAKVKTKEISDQLYVPKTTLNNWFRDSKAAGSWTEVPGQVSNEDSFWHFLCFKLGSVFFEYLRLFKSKSHIQGQFCKVEIKGFNLAPRLIELHAF